MKNKHKRVLTASALASLSLTLAPSVLADETTATTETPIVTNTVSETSESTATSTETTENAVTATETAQEQATGSVVVSYLDEYGNNLQEPVSVVNDAPVGTAYDTTDKRPKVIIGNTPNTIYESPYSENGNDTGLVSEGVTNVNYIYSRVNAVAVEYRDEKGNTISEPALAYISYDQEYDATPYRENEIDYNGKTYSLIYTSNNEKGTAPQDRNTIVTYGYSDTNGAIVVTYLDENGNEISNSDTIVGPHFTNASGHIEIRERIEYNGKTYELYPASQKDEPLFFMPFRQTLFYSYREVTPETTNETVDESNTETTETPTNETVSENNNDTTETPVTETVNETNNETTETPTAELTQYGTVTATGKPESVEYPTLEATAGIPESVEYPEFDLSTLAPTVDLSQYGTVTATGKPESVEYPTLEATAGIPESVEYPEFDLSTLTPTGESKTQESNSNETATEENTIETMVGTPETVEYPEFDLSTLTPTGGSETKENKATEATTETSVEVPTTSVESKPTTKPVLEAEVTSQTTEATKVETIKPAEAQKVTETAKPVEANRPADYQELVDKVNQAMSNKPMASQAPTPTAQQSTGQELPKTGTKENSFLTLFGMSLLGLVGLRKGRKEN